MARGHEVWLETWERWREHVEREGMRFAAAPEYHVFGSGEAAAQALRRRRCGPAAATRELIREFDPDAVVADILTVAASLAAQAEERPWATLIPHVLPTGRARAAALLGGRACRRAPRVGAAAVGARCARC